MRLGEIRNILHEVIKEDNKISIEHEAIFGGQAQTVKNYGPIISALDVLANLSWNETDYAPIELIKKEYGTEVRGVQLPQDKFSQLNAYVVSLNSKLPLYISILETMVQGQDEHTINIKLSDSIKDLNNLTATNTRLGKILDLYNADGQFDFKGFDKGTDWYVVVATGILSYRFFIAGLDISQKYFETRKVYFESENAKLDLQAALDKEDVTKTDIESYQKRKMELLIKDEVKKAIDKIGVGANNKNELITKIIKATEKLVKELDEEGTEFHLSLNPPEYANEYMGSLVIDYSKMPVLNNKKEEKAKQIATIKEVENVEEDEK